MELQFVGDIKAVKTGDKFKAYGTLQSRRTGNYIKVETEIDVPRLIAEARAIYNAARQYLAAQGKDIEALPGSEGGLYGDPAASSLALPQNATSDQAYDPFSGAQEPDDANVFMGRKVTLASALKRQRQGKKLNSGELALVQEHQAHAKQAEKRTQREQVTAISTQLRDEKKKQIVQAQMRAEAARRLSERRQERAGYEEKLKELKDQIASSAADASRQAELSAQAEQYEARIAQAADAAAQQAVQYESQIAQIQSMPAVQVAQLPAANTPEVNAAVADEQPDAGLEGLQLLGWSFGGLFKKFKKALAVVFRSKIVKGLVKVAVKNGGKWKVPGLGIKAEHAKTWLALLSAAKSGDARSKAITNRIKLMARLGHPKATKTFWLLRDLEKLTPEVKAKLAAGGPEVSAAAAESETEPSAVPEAQAMSGLYGMGAESAIPVRVRCLDFNPVTMGWRQIPFTMAIGKKKPSKAQRAAAAARLRATIAARNAKINAARNQPTGDPNQPGVMPAPLPQPGAPGGYQDPYYGQPSGSQAGYPPGYDPYNQGYDPYQPANYAPGVQPVDPYTAAYAATPPNYDPYAQSYAAQAQAYGDYSQAQNQPGFDPYNPASYGY